MGHIDNPQTFILKLSTTQTQVQRLKMSLKMKNYNTSQISTLPIQR